MGVWYWQKEEIEDEEMWDKIFTMEGGSVNFFFSKKPAEAMSTRNKL